LLSCARDKLHPRSRVGEKPAALLRAGAVKKAIAKALIVMAIVRRQKTPQLSAGLLKAGRS
jgi:hypothetical protein